MVSQEEVEAAGAEKRREEQERKKRVQKAVEDNERRRRERLENEERLRVIRRAIRLAEKKLGPLDTATRIALFKLSAPEAAMVLGSATITAGLDGLVEGCTTNRDFALKMLREDLGLEK